MAGKEQEILKRFEAMKRMIPIVILLAVAVAAGVHLLSASDAKASARQSAHALWQH